MPKEDTQFKPGNNANPKGRPPGSKNKLGEEFIRALQEDFNEHGPTVIETVRREKPDQYLKVIASVIPKDMNINVSQYDNMSDEQLFERLRQLRAQIGTFLTDDGGNAGAGTTEETTRH